MTAADPQVHYPNPIAWSRPARVGVVAAGVVSFAVGVACIVLGVEGVVIGRWFQAGAGLLAGPAILIAVAAIVRRSASRKGTGIPAGLPSSPGRDGLRLATPRGWALAATVMSALVAAATLSLSVEAWLRTGGSDMNVWRRMLFPAVGTVTAIAIVRDVAFRLSVLDSGTVGLTPTRISVDKSFTSVQDIRWDDITSVTPDDGRGDRARRLKIIVTGSRAEPSLVIFPDDLTIGARATFWLVDFYWRHPEARSELSDDRVLARLRDGSLVERDGRCI
ncbi:hypothetical protein nbrc107696_40440 [Gordonia spumicola]|uniref:Uncharacterized protein n=1 Tax=Gordonia spumicola TaxID=589161 RepID=A0A7I9VE20_9ACTN|nr:hypothetical protein [Gordonia spumicola]GEE03598.1 hypothetical protein nbrc107696_40440 [Gordonia spumicola]